MLEITVRNRFPLPKDIQTRKMSVILKSLACCFDRVAAYECFIDQYYGSSPFPIPLTNLETAPRCTCLVIVCQKDVVCILSLSASSPLPITTKMQALRVADYRRFERMAPIGSSAVVSF